MNRRIVSYDRSRQILTLLAAHGPLSVRGITALLSPPIQRRRLQDALKRLKKSGLTTTLYDNIFGGAAVFHRITRDKRKWPDISKRIEKPIESIDDPTIQHRELIHSELCAVWTERLKSIFPEAQILRDFQFARDPQMLRLLLPDRDDKDVRPDILIVLQSAAERGEIAVAIEIERTRKSDKRLTQKLYKYSAQTLLDGVIYLCEIETINDRLRHIYSSKILQRAPRINWCGDFFLMFSDPRLYTHLTSPILTTSQLKNINLTSWMQILVNTKRNWKRNEIFETSAHAR